MKAVRLKPYRTASRNVVDPGEWLLVTADKAARLGDEVPGWDALEALTLRRSLRIDGTDLARQCALGPDARVSARIGWFASGTRLRGASTGIDVPLDARSQIDVEVTIPGESIAGSLSLRVLLVLDTGSAGPEARAPRVPGSVLWESETRRVALEGSAGGFPIQVVSFGQSKLLPEHAVWSLKMDASDLGGHPSTGLTLFVNKEVEWAVAAVTGGETDRDVTVRSLIMADVARQMIHRYLLSEALDSDDVETAPESLRSAILGLIDLIFPKRSIDALRQELKGGSGWIDTQIQEWILRSGSTGKR